MSRTDIQKKIAATIEEIVHLKRVNAQLDETTQELHGKYDDLEKLNKKLGKELRDIEKLEGLSTASIFHKILGNKEKQIEKERQEYLAVTLEHEDLQKSIEILEYEVNLLEAKAKSKEPLEQQLEQLKGQREREIIQSDESLREQLLSISTDLERQYALRKELSEAIEAGKVSASLIAQVIHHLKRVKNWGAYSSSRGGQMYRMQQRDAIDRARNLSYQVQHHLQIFDRELRDLGVRLTTSIDTSQFSNFTNFFFNNIITDWIMQQKLTSALQSVHQTSAEVIEIISGLEREYAKAEQEIETLVAKRENILLA